MSRRKKFIPIAVLILFIIIGSSKAEPTSTISYLMNTPVSMLDFGIYKLESRLFEMRESWAIAKFEPTVQVQYRYDLNRIIILLRYAIFKKDDIKDIQKIDIKHRITMMIKSLKTLGFALNSEGIPSPFENSVMELYFGHVGYEIKGEPKNIGKELDQITEIYVEFFNGKEWIKCKSPLIGNTMYWSK